MILTLLLAHATGWVLIILGATTGVINGATILGALLIMGSAIIHRLSTHGETTMKVTTQAELDSALADATVREIIIDSPSGVWLSLDSNGKGSSSVEARGSSHVEASGSSHVEASKYVAIHLHSKHVTLSGNGVVIDVTDIDTYKVGDFLEYHGVTVEDGWATVYKAVDDNLLSGYEFKYPIGETVTAPDWRPTNACGHGLHFGYRPAVAKSYFDGATRFLECRVKVEGLIALDDKVKAQSCVVVREVDIHGDEVTR